MDSQTISTLCVIGFFASLSVLAKARSDKSVDDRSRQQLHLLEYEFDIAETKTCVTRVIVIAILAISGTLALKLAGGMQLPKADLLATAAELLGAIAVGWTSAGLLITFSVWWQLRESLQLIGGVIQLLCLVLLFCC